MYCVFQVRIKLLKCLKQQPIIFWRYCKCRERIYHFFNNRTNYIPRNNLKSKLKPESIFLFLSYLLSLNRNVLKYPYILSNIDLVRPLLSTHPLLLPTSTIGLLQWLSIILDGEAPLVTDPPRAYSTLFQGPPVCQPSALYCCY